MTPKDYLTIGEVVQRLQGAYPDLSISKVRFLEEEGLVSPERTAGGYRKFSQPDVSRIEMILRMQKENFLPLAIIREKLADFDRGKIPAELASPPVGMTAPLPLIAEDESPLMLEESQSSIGVPRAFIEELAEYHLVTIEQGEDGPYIERPDTQIVHAAWDLRKYGVEPRHLRMYENFSEREAALFSQILMPAFRHRTADSRQKLAETLADLGDLTDGLKGRLLRRALASAFEDLR